MALARRSGGAAGGGGALSDATIVARSSGSPPAAIGIIRISGIEALSVAETLMGTLPPPRYAAVRTLRDGAGDVLDRALVLVFPAGGSATGEDLVELHCHGGRAVLAAVERAVLQVPGTRPAEPGEFTRRALLNGRIDLTQAQGLADLLSAETESGRRLAVRAAEGEVSRAIAGWMDRLTSMAASIEASIEFGEEGDVVAEAASLAAVQTACDALVGEMSAAIDAPAVERWHEGWRVVLAGPPNAGKSTLVNLLAGRDAAIVSPIAGTTRDVIEVPVQRDGVGYVLIDTAGRRDDSSDPIERAGIDRARLAAEGADVLLWVDDSLPPPGDIPSIHVHARSDEMGRAAGPSDSVATSHGDRRSIDLLWGRIAAVCGSDRVSPVPLHRGEREMVRLAIDHLTGVGSDVVLAAEALRAARRLLGTLLGLDATEALYDRIFSRFCIGK